MNRLIVQNFAATFERREFGALTTEAVLMEKTKFMDPRLLCCKLYICKLKCHREQKMIMFYVQTLLRNVINWSIVADFQSLKCNIAAKIL